MTTFETFCKREMIDPGSFRQFIFTAYHNPTGFIQHNDLLWQAWREYLSCLYMNMIIKEEMK